MMRAASASAFLIAAVTAAACSSAGTGDPGDGGPVDPEELPVLEITSPERGTFSEQESVTITGRVSDNEPGVKVTVNGQQIVADADGNFTAAVSIGRGLGFLETHAVDADGNDVRDVRSVLAGPVSLSDGSQAAPIGAHADTAALRKIGDALANTAEQIDFNAAVQAMNPVFNDSGCLGAKVDVTGVSLANIGIALDPKTGALGTHVEIDNVVVNAHVKYKVACIGGSSNVTVRATKARIDGDLGVQLAGGAIKTALPNATVALDGFSVDASGIPGAIEDLLEGRVRDAIANALTDVIRNNVPGMADEQLAGLIGQPISANLLGHMTHLGLAPTAVNLSAGGLYVAVNTDVVVEGGEGGMYVSTPASLSSEMLASTAGLSVALADDLANQLFSGLWAAGGLELSVPMDSIAQASILFDDNVRTLNVSFSLPPMITTVGSDLTFAIGDVIVKGVDDSGAEVQTLALSVQSTVVAAPDAAGVMALQLGTPTLKAQVLLQSAAVDNPLSGEAYEEVIGIAWGLIGPMANDALARLPMPTLAGISFGTPSLAGRDGFVMASIPVN